MTVNKEEESEKETNAALAVEIPTDSPPMYCVKTLQETSASVFRMVSVSFDWKIVTTLIYSEFAVGNMSDVPIAQFCLRFGYDLQRDRPTLLPKRGYHRRVSTRYSNSG